MGGFYMQYLESLCRRRGWDDPTYDRVRNPDNSWTCLVFVNGREYRTDLAYESDDLAQENAAMRAFMVCRNFSQNGGIATLATAIAVVRDLATTPAAALPPLWSEVMGAD
ncbi:hypothetical protein NKR19_g231 [Coniochaeta hoffmannii]|uniref:DRBM domain-containing protein n=1 Tax=Coniochaeta hoffmannii TaxID=91930 RepID=A0AA38W168_9PEZI|nr:hypothetical protein NKR19_g231 [Coniochaeta hoffmannii]